MDFHYFEIIKGKEIKCEAYNKIWDDILLKYKIESSKSQLWLRNLKVYTD